MAENLELLFFDTFSHESSEELNLDLVQFPKSVFISEVRIIPLGARVQADFPGGVRLGATNPSQFQIEFFVNDLSKPGASTFESLGELEYKQNGTIHLACEKKSSTIPTDGLVLRGWYSTITLAVYGSLTKGLAEQLGSSTAQSSVTSDLKTSPRHNDWPTEAVDNMTYPPEPQDYPTAYPSDAGGYRSQEYPPSYPDQWNAPQTTTTLLPSTETYDAPKDTWESDKVWERGKEHPVSSTVAASATQWDRSEWEHHERSDWPSSNRGWRPPHPHRGRTRGPSWEPPMEEIPRKRPYTPPAPLDDKWTNDKEQAASFDATLSPGDVESISSEGDIPLTEEMEHQTSSTPPPESFTPQPPPVPSPPPTPDDPEQFEPILSDEDNMEDLDQDADFEDNEEPEKVFDAFAELQPLKYLADPSLSEGEAIAWRLKQSPVAPPPEVVRLHELLNTKETSAEAWVCAVEQAASLVVLSLPHSPESIPTLIEWAVRGLNIDQAKLQTQPGLNLRHLKAGLRLTLSMCFSTHDALNALNNAGIHKLLYDVLNGENMALPLRLLALRTLDASIQTSETMESFINHQGYEKLITQLQQIKIARVQYAITSIIRKVHYYQTIKLINEFTVHLTKNIVDDKFSLLFQDLVEGFKDAHLRLGQFLRFLPVKSQFDLPNAIQDPYVSIYSYFKHHKILECMLFILSNLKNINDMLISPVLNLLELFLDNESGLRFLASNSKTSLGLIKVLLSSGESTTSGRLGIKLAYCMKVLSGLDKLCLLQAEEKLNSETNALDILRILYCYGETLTGRLSVAHVLTKGDFIKPVVAAILSNQGALPGKSYAMDLLINSIMIVDNQSYLIKHNDQIKLVIAQEQRLNNLNLWLKTVNFTNVASLCENIKNLEEKAGNLPSELISALRTLKHLALPANDEFQREFVELKQRNALLELFSLDGVTLLANIVTKVTDTFEQPALHTAIMLGPKGTRLVALMLPALSLLRAMLSLVAHSQGANFRNLTTVPALLASYTLLHAFPHSSPLLPLALQARSETVLALLAYTQPCSEEALPKSLWTQMLAEVLKHATLVPNTFLPGLELLSELLPLPLPLASEASLSEEESARITSLHRLWGAHLHPLASAIHETISLLGAASSPPLVALVLRVCLQLSDLDPSSALMVGRALLEPTIANIKSDNTQNKCSTMTMRRLSLLSNVSLYPAPKSALLHLLRQGNNEESLTLLSWALLKGEPSGKAQCCVAQLLSNLCDPKAGTFGTTLVALPSKELLSGVCSALVQFLIDGSKYGSKPVLTTLEALQVVSSTEHGLYQLKMALETKEKPLLPLLTTCTSSPELTGPSLSLLNICTKDEPAAILAKLIGWPAPEDAKHPITALSDQPAVGDWLKSLEDLPTTEILPIRELSEPATASAITEPLAAQFAQRRVASPHAEEWGALICTWDSNAGPLERLDLAELSAAALPELNLSQELARLSQAHRADEQARKDAALFQARDRGARRPYLTPMRGRVLYSRVPQVSRGDTFRSRPPNTSRPPSLHVDDFLALESAGHQPTGPTGYNKQTIRAKELMVTRPRVRSRGVVSERGARFPNPNMVYRRDTSRGISRGIVPGRGDWQSTGIRPSGDKVWERGGSVRRDLSRHPRTFSR